MSGAPPPPPSRRSDGASPAAPPAATRPPVGSLGWHVVCRALARLLDTMLVTVIVAGAVGVASSVDLGAHGRAAVLALSLLAYGAAGERLVGTTVGKRIFRLQVRDPGGRRPGVLSATGRNVLPVVAATGGFVGVALGVALGISIATGRGVAIHDRLTGLRVTPSGPASTDGGAA